MTHESTNARLEEINARLIALNLKPLSKLGDASRGEIEILSIIEIYDHSSRFFYDIKFEVVFPNGARGEFTDRLNANSFVSDGAVIVPIVNGKFAIVKQWRLPLARWTYEIPRGFGEKLDAAHINGNLGTMKIGDLPLGNLTRELGEEVMKDAVITSVTHLGNVAENSGTHGGTPSYYLVQISVPEDSLEAKIQGSGSELKVQLWEAQRVRQEIGGKLCDGHSITAVALTMRHIESLPRLNGSVG